jgi:epoxyqueuosine reductase
VPDAKRLLDDPSPLIRGAAVWALSQLVPRTEFVALRREDSDAGVEEEWRVASKMRH